MVRVGQMVPSPVMVLRNQFAVILETYILKPTMMNQFCMDIRCTEQFSRQHGVGSEGFMDKTHFMYQFINFSGMGLKNSASAL